MGCAPCCSPVVRRKSARPHLTEFGILVRGVMSALGGKQTLARLRFSHMRDYLTALAAFAALPAPAHAQSGLERGFSGALRGCEEWVLDPASWADGTGPVVKAVGLGDQMGLVDRVEEVNLPPQQLRKANHYWRINSTQGAGYVLVVSDQLPMCHITGGGNTDLEPAVEAVIASPEFGARWERITDRSKADMASTEFRNRQDPRFSIVISRAKPPGQRLDRVQVLATATYNTDK
jgi:hypothetical protein